MISTDRRDPYPSPAGPWVGPDASPGPLFRSRAAFSFASSELRLGGSFSVICRSSSDVPRYTHYTKTLTPVRPAVSARNIGKRPTHVKFDSPEAKSLPERNNRPENSGESVVKTRLGVGWLPGGRPRPAAIPRAPTW